MSSIEVNLQRKNIFFYKGLEETQLVFTCSMLIIETLEQGVTPCSSVFIVNFEHVIAGWEVVYYSQVYLSKINNRAFCASRIVYTA